MTGTGIVPGTNVLIFNHATVPGNKVLGVVLNSTGNIVAISDTLVIQAGDLGLYHNFVFNSTAVFTNEDFYVGLVQIPGAAQYYPLSMQLENPQRGNTFYSFPLGGGTPSVETYNGKYMIEARVSVPTVEIVDVGTLSVDVASSQVPGSVTPKATFKNLGTHPRTFDVQMTITGGYSSIKTITNLTPGATQQVTFDNWTASLGEFSVKAWTQAPGDINANNDTLYKAIGVYSGSWTNGSAYPTTTYLGGGAGYVSTTEATTEYLFSIGGNTSSNLGTECYKYNVTTNTWSPIASLPAGQKSTRYGNCR